MNMYRKGSGGSKLVTFSIVAMALVVLIAGGLYINDKFHLVGGNTLTVVNQPTPQGSGCSVPLSVAQTPAYQSFDMDTQSALTPGTTVFQDAVAGIQAAGSNSVPGKGYTVLFNKTGYGKARVDFTTSCTEAAPQVTGKQEALDTSISATIYNVGGRTANAAASRQALTASSPSTVQLELTPSALNKHIGLTNNQFVVFLNASNTTDFDTSGMQQLSLYGAWSGTCAQYQGPTPAAFGGVTVIGWTCTADFSGKDTATYGIYATIKPSSSYAAGNRTYHFEIVPVDYFTQTAAGSTMVNGAVVNVAAGSIQAGAVKDSGAAIQTAQAVLFYAS